MKDLGGGKGAVSFFGERNPLYRIGTVAIGTTAGVGTSYNFTDKVRLDAGFLSGRSNFATDRILPNGRAERGLGTGTTSVLAQISFTPNEKSQFSVLYMHGQHRDGNIRFGVGSLNANLPFQPAGVGPALARPLTSNSVGVQGTYRVLEKFAIGGWFGYTRADEEGGPATADIFNGAINLAFPDVGKEGAIAGLIVGVPPQASTNTFLGAAGGRINEDPGTTVHIEALYQFPLNSNIVVTPGIIYLINPEADDANSDIVVGVIRTTFRF